MIHKAFTLIELIFAIVIIGVLSAVSVPKFIGLNDKANVSTVIKMVRDVESSAVSSAVNYIDINGFTSSELSDFIELSGNNISYDSSSNDGTYNIKNDSNEVIAYVTFKNDDRNITVSIDCSKFGNSQQVSTCNEKIDQPYIKSYIF